MFHMPIWDTPIKQQAGALSWNCRIVSFVSGLDDQKTAKHHLPKVHPRPPDIKNCIFVIMFSLHNKQTVNLHHPCLGDGWGIIHQIMYRYIFLLFWGARKHPKYMHTA